MRRGGAHVTQFIIVVIDVANARTLAAEAMTELAHVTTTMTVVAAIVLAVMPGFLRAHFRV